MALQRRDVPDEYEPSDEERRRVQREENQPAIAFLDSLLNANEEEAEDHRETLEYLMRVLDEDRLSDRKLFSGR